MGMMQKLPGVLDPLPGGKSMVNAVDFVVNWARANSLWPLTYGTSCCAIEMMASAMPRYDISRFGSEVFRASPRQADLIILAGTLVEKMVEPLQTLYDQVPGPKYVLAMGACTISGGPFYYDNYSVVKGADRIVPVDVYIPGCPPRPEALLDGLMKLQELIKKETIRKSWKPRPLNTAPPVNPHAEAEAAWAKEEAAKEERMAEARKKFKEENPDYKAPKPYKGEREKFEEVPRIAPRAMGLAPKLMFSLIREKFPSVILCGVKDDTDETLDQLTSDYTVDLEVDEKEYVALVNFLKSRADLAIDYLIQLTAIDWPDRFEVVVQLLSTAHGHKVFLRCPLKKEEGREPVLHTLSHIHAGANWHEREAWEMFGIRFENHPDLRRLLLPDDFEGFPLRKDWDDEQKVIHRPY